MILEFLLLFALPAGGMFYFFQTKYNTTYKKYQQLFSTHQLKDTPEIQDPITLKLQSGQVPAWLNGIMYRIGPGLFNIKQKSGTTFSIKHAFDGLPFMHRFQVDGQAQTLTYNSRCLANSVKRSIQEETDKGSIFFGHVPIVTLPQFILGFFARIDSLIIRPKLKLPDNQSIGVTATPNYPLPSHWKKDGERVLVSKTDANMLQKIHADTLEPEKIFDYGSYDKKLQGQFSAAHHQWDPVTKESFNFTLELAPKTRLIVFKASESGEITVLANITQRKDGSTIQAAYIHSFWLTENYVIIPEAPLAYKDKGLNMLLNGSALSSMTWVDGAPTWFHVFGRKQEGLVASIPGPAFFTFHVANAFDTINQTTGDVSITLDSASFNEGNIMQQLHNFGTPHRKGPKSETVTSTTKLNGILFPPVQQDSFGDLVRYKLNVTQSKLVSQDVLCKDVEFPRFNQDYATKSTCTIVYGCELKGFTEKSDETIQLIKTNTETGVVSRYGQEGFSCSEPIFVPKPNATKEDDGVLLTLVNNFDCCYLIIVDAENMTELARFAIGKFTAVTFHGSFVDYEFKSININ